jgi:phosphate:Na+ symporter
MGCQMPDVAVYTDTMATYPYAEKAIAATHSGFNILNMLFFLPWVGVYARFLTWLVPDKLTPESPKLTYLDIRMFDTPVIALEQSAKEIVKMAGLSRDSMSIVRSAQQNASIERNRIEKVFQVENDLDVMQKEIVEFLGTVITGNLSHEMIEENRRQIRMADEFESISDYLVNLVKLRFKMRDNNLHFSDAAKQEILEIHSNVSEFLDFVCLAMVETPGDPAGFLSEAYTKSNGITSLVKESRTKHLARVESGKSSPLKSLIYTDMLTSYRRIKDHILNIAEVLGGEK